MFRQTIITLVCLAAAVSAGPLSIHKSTRGIVGGIVSCGSQGQIVEVRFTDCTDMPCQISVGKTYTVEADFIPVASHPLLNVKAAVSVNGMAPITLIEEDVSGPFEAGMTYGLKFDWPVTGQFGTGPASLRIEVQEGDVLELCGVAQGDINP